MFLLSLELLTYNLLKFTTDTERSLVIFFFSLTDLRLSPPLLKVFLFLHLSLSL